MKHLALLTVVVCLILSPAGKLIAAATLTTLHTFTGVDGSAPEAGLALGTNGNLYGTTVGGGTGTNASCIGGCGTVFEISTAGALTSLYSFNEDDGDAPRAGLLQASDGNLYGTTAFGGTFGGLGTVFRITASGVLTNLHTFRGTEGISPEGTLIEGPNGILYGTTAEGGVSSPGTAYQITTNGLFTPQFNGNPSPGFDQPAAGLLLASDGNFYGTSEFGGTSTNCNQGCGAIFKITTNGVVTTIHSFDKSDGQSPKCVLVEKDGVLYGTTSGSPFGALNCSNGCGTVFSITTNGDFTTLHEFAGPEGKLPLAGLVFGDDGNLYGTASGGGGLFGCVYQVTTNGTVTKLVSFSGANGGKPVAPLVLAPDGAFYGTTEVGGSGTNAMGTVFKLTITTNGASTVACTVSPALATNTVGTAHTVTATVTSNGVARSGALINYRVTVGPNAGQTGTATTSVSGQGSFTYTGGATPGTDTIRAISLGATGTATKVWIAAVPNQPPVAVCQDVTTNANASCQAVLVAADFDGGSIDNDGTITTRVINPTGRFGKGAQQVVLTVTDNNGASSSCTTTVTIVDNTAPTITCPATVIVAAAAGESNAVVNFSSPLSHDNCPDAVTLCVPAAGATFDLGTTTVTCTTTDTGGNTNSCGFDVIVQPAPAEPHDLAVVKLKAPKKITFKSGVTSVTGKFTVSIQNNATHNEVIPDFSTLQNLVTVTVESLGACPSFTATMTPPKAAFPITLAPKKKLNLGFTGNFNCVNDPLASSKTAAHPDYKTVAHVSHPVLDGIADTVNANDDCPHNPFGLDKGCGGKTPAGTLGGDVKTDVIVK